MILILASNTDPQSADYQQLTTFLAGLEGINTRVHTERGAETILTEIYLIGNTKALDIKDMKALPCVENVVHIDKRLFDRQPRQGRGIKRVSGHATPGGKR